MTNHPSFRSDDDNTSECRYETYDGEGASLGRLTYAEAQARYSLAVLETDEETGVQTITVQR